MRRRGATEASKKEIESAGCHNKQHWGSIGSRFSTTRRAAKCFVLWYPGWDLNPHFPYGKTDFKSVVSADFTTRAGETESPARFILPLEAVRRGLRALENHLPIRRPERSK